MRPNSLPGVVPSYYATRPHGRDRLLRHSEGWAPNLRPPRHRYLAALCSGHSPRHTPHTKPRCGAEKRKSCLSDSDTEGTGLKAEQSGAN